MSLRLWLASIALAIPVSMGCHEVHLDYEGRPGEIDVYDDLFSVSVTDDQHAVAVGYKGAAYWTADGGDTWKKGKTGTHAILNKVSMADPQNGWAVGQRGLILRTEDGGQSWAQQPNLKLTEGYHLFSVAAIDEDNAVAVGEWGTRIRTSDGGKTWQDQSFTISEDHPQYVWLAPGEKDRVRAGEKVYEDVGLNDVYCRRAPEQRCWLIGEFGYIFFSTDAGRSWQRSTIAGSVEMTPIRTGYNEIRIDELEQERIREFGRGIVEEQHLNVAIEAMASKAEMDEFGRAVEDAEDVFQLFEVLDARSQEVISVLESVGIEPDRLRKRGQPPWDFEDFLEGDPEFLERYLTRQTYEHPGVKVRVIQNPYLFTVRFRDSSNGLISALGGVILRSEDGGETFEYVKIDRQQALFATAAIDGRAVTVGEKGLIRVSIDDGLSWSEIHSGGFPKVFTFMRDIEFEPTGKLGLIVGQTGRIYRSTDAGFQWEQVLFPPRDLPRGGDSS